MLGISSYFQDLDYDYLKKAHEIGAKYLFTSLHIPEEDYSKLPEIMPVFLKKVEEFGLELVPDISPATFEKLSIPLNNTKMLKELGFKTIRLDYGFDDLNVVMELMEDFDLVLNASLVDEQYILDAQKLGMDFSKIKVMHNFYPKGETGLSVKFFDTLNSIFVKYGLQIMAFVPGDRLKRFPLYEGLPTIEKHRQIHPYVAAVELNHDYGAADILIGDSFAKITTLRYIHDYVEHKIMNIPVVFEREYLDMYDKEYQVRKDLADTIVRVVTPRIEAVAVCYNNYRRRGSITMDNHLAGRYSGEIQIMRSDMGADARRNVIGFIHPDYVDLINYIDSTTTLRFVRINEDE